MIRVEQVGRPINLSQPHVQVLRDNQAHDQRRLGDRCQARAGKEVRRLTVAEDAGSRVLDLLPRDRGRRPRRPRGLKIG